MPFSPVFGLPLPEDGNPNNVRYIADFLEKLESAITYTDRAHIVGLQLSWVSATAIDVGVGAAYLPDNSGVLGNAAVIHKTGLALTASTFYHVYLYSNAGVAAAEVVTTAPVAYFGTAYQKTGDTTRRYLGSILTDASGNILNFDHNPNTNFMRYKSVAFAAPFRVLNGGTATTETAVSFAGVVPVTSRRAYFRLTNTATNTTGILTGTPDDSITLGSGALGGVDKEDSAPHDHPLDSSRAITYKFTVAPTGGAGYADCFGYWFDR